MCRSHLLRLTNGKILVVVRYSHERLFSCHTRKLSSSRRHDTTKLTIYATSQASLTLEWKHKAWSTKLSRDIL
jgi:hypothetical protein